MFILSGGGYNPPPHPPPPPPPPKKGGGLKKKKRIISLHFIDIMFTGSHAHPSPKYFFYFQTDLFKPWGPLYM